MADKKILAIVSNFGYWGVELTGPRAKLIAAGYKLTYATPSGKRPEPLPPSYDTSFFDPPLNKRVTTEADARQVMAYKDSPELDNPVNISTWMPQRPYVSLPDYKKKQEAYSSALRIREKEMSVYASLLLVGGSGPIIDVVNNQRVHDIILAFYRAKKPIAAICYGVATLLFARDWKERTPIIRGKHVTGHCLEYDYLDGTGFLNTDLNMGPPPYTLEYLLRDAVGPKGEFHGNVDRETSVIVDHPFITARSLQCSHEFGEQFVNVLDKGLKRYGW